MQALAWRNLRQYLAVVVSLLYRHAGNLAEPTHGNLDHEQLVRVGALAAGAVHDLRSPLTTMAVLVDELRRPPEADDRRTLAEDLRVMSDQIEACRRILSRLALEANRECEQAGPGDDSTVFRKKLDLFGGRV
jgi:signal transduction histidine kinase